ncbi:MAG: LlaJI family restriction endonuclease [Micavibrio sp.]
MNPKALPSSILYEGAIGSSDDWQLRLNVSKQIIEDLQSQSILRKVSGNLGLRLDYVGLISFKDQTYFALPKIYNETDDDITTNLQSVFSCLQQYFFRKKARRISFSEAGEGTFFDDAGAILDLFLALLKWTQEHGFYQSDSKVRYDEYSHVNWRQTISEKFPVNFGTSLVYVEPIGYRVNKDNNQITELQAFAMLDLVKKIGPLSEIWLSTYDEIILSAKNIIINSDHYYGDRASISNAIDELIFSSNKDFDRELLDLLAAWIDLDYKASNLQLYGTNAFHFVWEDMCVSFFQRHSELKQHSKFASQPVLISGETFAQIGPQRPDILFEIEESIWIADAKWYDFDKGDRPPLHDIVKQMTYQTTILPDKKTGQNLFLLPGVGGEKCVDGGYIEMQYMERRDPRFPKIKIIRINWENALEIYLDTSPAEWWEEFIEVAYS